MSRLTIHPLPLPGLCRITRKSLEDERGFLSRLFCTEELTACGWNKPISQINHSYTNKYGTVRGMHFQKAPHAEIKLVTCIRGKVWDVAVDNRPDSKTYLHWYAEELSSENNNALLIPEGFAHGFQALTNETELIYCHSAPYTPEAEDGLHVLDPILNINWPLKISQLSERDNNFSFLPPNESPYAK